MNKKLERGEGKDRENVVFGMLNIQGLTEQKLMELEILIKKEIDILFLTETQLRIDKMKISKGLSKMDTMRNEKAKKGGGLMVIYKENEQINLIKKMQNMMI